MANKLNAVLCGGREIKMNFADFFNALKEARFGFTTIRDAIFGLYQSITQNPDIQPLWGWFMSVIAPFFTIVIAGLILFSLICTFFGKKMMGFLKFLAFLIIGFFLGMHFLAPLIPASVPIPSWVVGLVVGIVASVLSKFLYLAIYAVSIGYSMYIFAYWGFYIPQDIQHTDTRALICLAIAVVTVIIAFVVRKYFEMLLTAVGGAYVATMYFIWFFYNFLKLPFLVGFEWIAILVVVGVIALLGFAVQVKTRRRY